MRTQYSLIAEERGRHIGEVGGIVAVLAFSLFPVRRIKVNQLDVLPPR